ncbi:MAG: hypothetical protein HQL82_12265 [Magnetococcales bacterium]|nr:hypothetical protein [Magnetococcales bacterium]
MVSPSGPPILPPGGVDPPAEDALLALLRQAREESWPTLDLSGRTLTRLPPAIGSLERLERLFLADNLLTELPPEIGRLQNLELLDLRRNHLRTLPEALAELPRLAFLWLGENGLDEVPPQVFRMTQLRRLVLRGNRLTHLPPELDALTLLEELAAPHNRLERVSGALGQLTNLSLLLLGDNRLAGLPDALATLERLERIDLRKNDFREIPRVLASLPALKILDLRDNPLPVPPELLEDPEHPASLLDHWQARHAGRTQPLNQARILVVGPQGAGKSALIRRLLDGRFEPDGRPTPGLAIRSGLLAGAAGAPLRVDYWELGGAEPLAPLHPLFAQGDLALLVVDPLAGALEEVFRYWLEEILHPGSRVPVILVFNKGDRHPWRVDCSRARRYPLLAAVVSGLSCTDGTEVDRLRQTMATLLDGLPQPRRLVPVTWLAVKERMEALEEPWLSREAFVTLCREEAVTSPQDLVEVTGLLHRLGTLLCLAGAGPCLNGEWLSRTLGRLYFSPAVARGGGLLTADSLPDPDSFDLLGRFLVQAGLAIVLGQGRLLLPGHLPSDPPDQGPWDPATTLWRIRCPALPVGLMTRFVVQAVRELPVVNLWRHGALLGGDPQGPRVRVWADAGQRSVLVQGSGPEAALQGLLAQVRRVLERCGSCPPQPPGRLDLALPGHPDLWVPVAHLRSLLDKGMKKIVPVGLDRELPLAPLLAILMQRGLTESPAPGQSTKSSSDTASRASQV